MHMEEQTNFVNQNNFEEAPKKENKKDENSNNRFEEKLDSEKARRKQELLGGFSGNSNIIYPNYMSTQLAGILRSSQLEKMRRKEG